MGVASTANPEQVALDVPGGSSGKTQMQKAEQPCAISLSGSFAAMRAFWNGRSSGQRRQVNMEQHNSMVKVPSATDIRRELPQVQEAVVAYNDVLSHVNPLKAPYTYNGAMRNFLEQHLAGIHKVVGYGERLKLLLQGLQSRGIDTRVGKISLRDL